MSDNVTYFLENGRNMDRYFNKRDGLTLGLIILTFTVGCGVKGNPKPPDHPPWMGRGLSGAFDDQNRSDRHDVPSGHETAIPSKVK